MADDRQSILVRWIETYRALIYKVVHAYASDHHDKQDLYQEIVRQLWLAIPRFERRASESTFLYRVALFAAMAWKRKERRQVAATDWEEATVFVEEENRDPRLEWLYEQIRSFDDVDRSLTLLMLDGYSYREIAEVLGLSESNVGVKLTRIRKRMTELLGKEGGNGL